MYYKKLMDLVGALLIAIDKGLINTEEARLLFLDSIKDYFNNPTNKE